MEKIVLTDQQKALIQKQIKGEYSPFFATEDEQVAMNEVLTKAEALIAELDAYDEMDGDLISWFWGKYQAQEAAAQ